MTTLEHGRGLYDNGATVLTFEIQGMTERDEIINHERRSFYERYAEENRTLRVGEYIVPMWGDYNLYPQDVADTISANKLLPELIEKQVRYLYGKGPYLYRQQDVNGRLRRIPVTDKPHIMEWLNSWERKGLECSVGEYLIRCIRDYYHVETVVSKFRFTKGRLLSTPQQPVAGLEFVGAEDARLASDDPDLANGYKKVRDKDCRFVALGDWLNPIRQNEFDIYPRFNPAMPYASEVAISWVKNRSFTKDIYAHNLWFRGLRDWIVGANLNPKYINSYLKNALNARIHVLIPGIWYEKKKAILQELCEKNAEYQREDKPLQPTYNGVKLIDDSGNPYEFSEIMMTEIINNEMKKITEYLSGEGKNQGKLFSSIKWDAGGKEAERWEFQEIPSKYKEFIQSLLEYDKRADEVILAGKGIDGSISNVSESGIISKSGGDVYYNYLIYINSLDIPEYYCTLDLNRAIALNFPNSYASGVRLGLYHEVPAKQAETTPNERLANTAGGQNES
jgi:hypothetical protein